MPLDALLYFDSVDIVLKLFILLISIKSDRNDGIEWSRAGQTQIVSGLSQKAEDASFKIFESLSSMTASVQRPAAEFKISKQQSANKASYSLNYGLEVETEKL